MRQTRSFRNAICDTRRAQARAVLLTAIIPLLMAMIPVLLWRTEPVDVIETWPSDVTAAANAQRIPSVDPQPRASQVISGESKLKQIELFNGKNLDGWKVTEFGGEGEVSADKGRLLLESGVDLTGVTWQKPELLPKTNYEVTLEAMRVDGNDFFCGLTFPVKDDPCSLIIGGWGGGVCGLSSIDGMDASENETTTYRPFESGRWYRIKLRVTDSRIDAWIDDQQIVEQEITGRKISIRTEVDLSRPFGIASWQTTAAIRKFRFREIEARMESHKPADE